MANCRRVWRRAMTRIRRTFVQTLFNRLMFIYFLSRKGWLRLDGDADYLSALWQDYGKGLGDSNFHRDRLRPLFFSGLEQPQLPGPDRGAADGHW